MTADAALCSGPKLCLLRSMVRPALPGRYCDPSSLVVLGPCQALAVSAVPSHACSFEGIVRIQSSPGIVWRPRGMQKPFVIMAYRASGLSMLNAPLLVRVCPLQTGQALLDLWTGVRGFFLMPAFSTNCLQHHLMRNTCSCCQPC